MLAGRGFGEDCRQLVSARDTENGLEPTAWLAGGPTVGGGWAVSMNRVYVREEQSETSPNIEECGEQRLWMWRLHVVVGLRMHGCYTHDRLATVEKQELARLRGPGVRQMREREARARERAVSRAKLPM
jgi:hypothetical protein